MFFVFLNYSCWSFNLIKLLFKIIVYIIDLILKSSYVMDLMLESFREIVGVDGVLYFKCLFLNYIEVFIFGKESELVVGNLDFWINFKIGIEKIIICLGWEIVRI